MWSEQPKGLGGYLQLCFAMHVFGKLLCLLSLKAWTIQLTVWSAQLCVVRSNVFFSEQAVVCFTNKISDRFVHHQKVKKKKNVLLCCWVNMTALLVVNYLVVSHDSSVITAKMSVWWKDCVFLLFFFCFFFSDRMNLLMRWRYWSYSLSCATLLMQSCKWLVTTVLEKIFFPRFASVWQSTARALSACCASANCIWPGEFTGQCASHKLESFRHSASWPSLLLASGILGHSLPSVLQPYAVK